MAQTPDKPRRRGAIQLGELTSKILDPVTAKRGFATADLIDSWAEIVGPRYADCTRPEKIVWAKGEDNEGKAALLILRVDGPRAILVQHETGQIIERVNAFLGYGAIGRLRIVQAPVAAQAGPEVLASAVLDPAAEARLAEAIAPVGDDGLRAALDRLGRGVLAETSPGAGRNRETP